MAVWTISLAGPNILKSPHSLLQFHVLSPVSPLWRPNCTNVLNINLFFGLEIHKCWILRCSLKYKAWPKICLSMFFVLHLWPSWWEEMKNYLQSPLSHQWLHRFKGKLWLNWKIFVGFALESRMSRSHFIIGFQSGGVFRSSGWTEPCKQRHRNYKGTGRPLNYRRSLINSNSIYFLLFPFSFLAVTVGDTPVSVCMSLRKQSF